jgi:hypothetical protein
MSRCALMAKVYCGKIFKLRIIFSSEARLISVDFWLIWKYSTRQEHNGTQHNNTQYNMLNYEIQDIQHLA